MVLAEDKQPKQRDTYHHGNLRGTLIDVGASLLAEKGAEGFSMREVARRAGVAVAAPSHHFGNAKGLLTAIATCGFEFLDVQLSAATQDKDDPVDKVVALCKRYVEMDAIHAGYAAVIFRWDLVDQSDPSYSEAARRALVTLTSTVAAATPETTSQTDVEHTARTLWATMQGFISLSMIDGEIATERIEFAVKTLLRGVYESSAN